MLAAIDPERLRAYDRRLVSFGTRNTLSEQDDPNHGIGAAPDYILRTVKRFAAQSDGRMTVRLQNHVQQPLSEARGGGHPRGCRGEERLAGAAARPLHQGDR